MDNRTPVMGTPIAVIVHKARCHNDTAERAKRAALQAMRGVYAHFFHNMPRGEYDRVFRAS